VIKQRNTVDNFCPGQRVRYIPRHANGDYWHPDCANGCVSSVNEQFVFVKYDNAAHGTMCTGKEPYTAQATDPTDLIIYTHVGLYAGIEFMDAALAVCNTAEVTGYAEAIYADYPLHAKAGTNTATVICWWWDRRNWRRRMNNEAELPPPQNPTTEASQPEKL
jgi:hypothetical protein